jgi:hypothetical protein
VCVIVCVVVGECVCVCVCVCFMCVHVLSFLIHFPHSILRAYTHILFYSHTCIHTLSLSHTLIHTLACFPTHTHTHTHSISLFDEETELAELVEAVHMQLFLVMMIFSAQVVLLVHLGNNTENTWVRVCVCVLVCVSVSALGKQY